MVLESLISIFRGRGKPGSPLKRIIIGVKPPVHDLLKGDFTENEYSMQNTAEHLIRLGIAAERELTQLGLLEEVAMDSIPVRGHLKVRRYIAVNRQLHYLIKGYGVRHKMTVKTATEHLICLGIVAQNVLEELESNEAHPGL